jgi:hypothetical protein
MNLGLNSLLLPVGHGSGYNTSILVPVGYFFFSIAVLRLLFCSVGNFPSATGWSKPTTESLDQCNDCRPQVCIAGALLLLRQLANVFLSLIHYKRITGVRGIVTGKPG